MQEKIVQTHFFNEYGTYRFWLLLQWTTRLRLQCPNVILASGQLGHKKIGRLGDWATEQLLYTEKWRRNALCQRCE